MKQYLALLEKVLHEGSYKDDRTKTGTYSYFGTQSHYNLNEGFPLVTTKKTNFKAIVVELLWFIKGDTNIKFLIDNGVNIWNEWPYELFKKSVDFAGETLKEFALKIKNDLQFAKRHGDLGPVYGKQWRNFNGVDQLKNVIQMIKDDPNSRRLIVSSWNPLDVPSMALPPCHTLFQFYVKDGKLSCQLYQRSADLFLGVPFNIASYALLTYLVAHVTNLKVGKFIHTTGDTHIYSNHLEQVKTQLSRQPKELATLKLNQAISKIEDFQLQDIELENYQSWPRIKGKVAV